MCVCVGNRVKKNDGTNVLHKASTTEQNPGRVMTDGYTTDEDADLAGEVLAGAIKILSGDVYVTHHLPKDSVEDAFFHRCVVHVLRAAQPRDGDVPGFVARLRLLMTAPEVDVRSVVTRSGACDELRGTSLHFEVSATDAHGEDLAGVPEEDVVLGLWIRRCVKTRRYPVLHPVPYAQYH